MPDLDPFEERLAAAIRALADNADTRTNPVAVAAVAISRRRRGGLLALPVRLVAAPLPVILLIGLMLAALFGSAMLVGSWWDQQNSIIPVASPAPTAIPAPTPTPTPTPTPSRDPAGWSYVTGTETFSLLSQGSPGIDGHILGIVVNASDTMDDPRVTGTGTSHLTAQSNGTVGLEWGTYRLENAGGTWEGSCSGSAWNSGDESDLTCWLAGSGDYKGLTYYLHIRSGGFSADLLGLVFPGSRP